MFPWRSISRSAVLPVRLGLETLEETSKKGKLVVVSGPSGSGKSTIVGRVVELPELRTRLSISMTTRPMRPGEIDGREYYFRTAVEFEAAKAAGELLEWANVHGNSYGTPAKPVEQALAEGVCVLLEIDVQGAAKVKSCKPDAVLVFIHPPSFAILEDRLRARGTDEPGVIARRLANARTEIQQATSYDFQLVNEQLDDCVRELASIVSRVGCGESEGHARRA